MITFRHTYFFSDTPSFIFTYSLRILQQNFLIFFLNFLNFLKVLPWLLAEMSSATDWTPCSSTCGWTAIKSRTLTADIGSANNLTTSDLGLMDNITTTTNESSNGSTIKQFAFCKLNPCDGK